MSRRLPLVAIVGRPNVGKSSLLNRLSGERLAITHDEAGTTRDANFSTIEWQGKRFLMADTAGITKPDGEIEVAAQDQIRHVAGDADMFVVVVDAALELTNEDLTAARLALKTKKPVILALGKADTMRRRDPNEFRRLGIETIVPVSAIQGQGTGDLLDAIVDVLGDAAIIDEDTDKPLRLALVGRPNVGKSSILNALVGKQKVVVSSIGGTTRDATADRVRYHDRSIEITDTAGIRRRGRIEQGVEKYSAMRTMAAVSQADVCMLILDAVDGVTAGDLNLAGQILEAGKGLILVMNKWDAVEEKDDKLQAHMSAVIAKQFQFCWWAPLIFTSAVTGLHVNKLLELATKIDESRETTITTGQLNRFLEKLKLQQPPAGLKGRRPKINYVTQTGAQPPEFTFFCTYPDLIHWGYKRFIENSLRKEYNFAGTPIRFVFKHKHPEAEYSEGRRRGFRDEHGGFIKRKLQSDVTPTGAEE
jgi:GTP-binding protein